MPESHLSLLNLIFQNINIKIILYYKVSTHINICIFIYTLSFFLILKV